MALTKVVQSSLFPIATVSAGTVVAGTPFPCQTMFSSSFYIDFAPTALTATPTATEWRIECSELDDNTIWVPIYSRLTTNDVPVNPNVTTATAATNTVIVSNISGFAVGQIIFLKNGTLNLSEWHEITAISGSTITTLDPLVSGQTGTNNIFNAGLRASIELPLNARMRYRAVVNNNRGTNRDVVMRIAHTTLTAVS